LKTLRRSNVSITCVITFLATFLVLLGWLLSPFRKLTQEVFILFAMSVLFFFVAGKDARQYGIRASLYSFIYRVKIRLKWPLPLIYYIALTLVLAGGLIHPPNNYDALSYRIPRILDWITNGGWYWIPTANERMNYSGAVQEWLFSPLLLVFRSYRPLFLINIVLFALLPYIIFSVFHHLGIQRRVAWWWMWLLPLSLGIVLQAGGIGNDLLGVYFFLVAADTALRFRKTGSDSFFFCSILAMGLCTGVKLSNLPLVLPWIMLIIPVWRKVVSQKWKLALVVFISVIASIAPIGVLNWINSGSWTGDPENRYELEIQDPMAGIIGNTILITVNNLAPPVLPFAKLIENYANNLPPFRSEAWLPQRFPHFRIPLNELPQEEASGAGLFITLLLFWSAIQAEKPRETLRENENGILRNEAGMFFFALILAVLVFFAVMGSDSSARLFLPYIIPAVAFVLWLRDSSRLVRTRAWFVAVIVCALMTLVFVVLSPSRPLFPVKSVLNWLGQVAPSSVVTRAATVYEVYDQRADVFAQVREDLDSGDHVLGFLSSGNDLETSLWLPMGSRRVVHVLPSSSLNSLLSLGVKKVLVSDHALQSLPATSQKQLHWLSEGKVIATYHIQQLASQEAEIFFLIEISPNQ
jgi:hypothetical protein